MQAPSWWARWSSRKGLSGWCFAETSPHKICDFAGTPMNLGVCVSGQGTNLRNLVERGFDVVAVVTDALDAGPILAQESVEVLPGDTVETLRQRVHEVGYRLLPAAIRLMEARIAKSSAVG